MCVRLRFILVAATISLGLTGCQFKRNDQLQETVTGVVVTPGDPRRVVGQTFPFQAVAFFQTPDLFGGLPTHPVRFVTGDVEWLSSNPAVATIDASGVATAVSVGASNISVIYQTILYKDVATFHVVGGVGPGRDLLYVSDSARGAISVFDSAADGDVAPLRTLGGPATTLMSPDQMVMYGEWLIVADRLAGAVLFFDANAHGDVAPVHAIRGLTDPKGLAILSDTLYVSGDATRGVLPFRLGPGPTTTLQRALSSGPMGHLASRTRPAEVLLVQTEPRLLLELGIIKTDGDYELSTIPTLDVNYSPAEAPVGVVSDGHFHYVSSGFPDLNGGGYHGTISVLAADVPRPPTYSGVDPVTQQFMTWSLKRSPFAYLNGSTPTLITDPHGVSVSSEHLYVACGDASILSFNLARVLGINGSFTAATSRIKGPKTGLSKPSGVLFVPDRSTPVTAVALGIYPTEPTIPVGGTVNFTAIANFSDGTSADVTLNSTWISSYPVIATVNEGGTSVGVAPGRNLIRVQWHGLGNGTNITVTAPVDMGTGSDMTATADLGMPPDMAAPDDMNATADLTATGDLSISPSDLAMSTDLTMSLLPDLTASGDMTFVPATLFVSDWLRNSISVFGSGATGGAVPTRILKGTSTLLRSPRQIVQVGQELVVVNNTSSSGSSIATFGLGDANDTAPLRTITSGVLNYPRGVAVQGDEILVAGQYGAIWVFPRLQNSTAAPIRTIAGNQTQLIGGGELWTDGSEILVAVTPGSRVLGFPYNGTGNILPMRDLSGAATKLSEPFGLTVAGGELFVADRAANAVFVYDLATAKGDVAPKRTLTGAQTGLQGPQGLAIFNGELFVTSAGNQTVRVWNVTDAGDQPPKRTLGVPTVSGGDLGFVQGTFGEPLGLLLTNP